MIIADKSAPTEKLNLNDKPALILDSHKLAWHYDRVQAWENHERIAPVSVDMALTRACQANCRGCYAVLQEPQERSKITLDSLYALLDDFATIGVRAISLVSDGESTISPHYVAFVQRATSLGIDVGNATNGWRLFPDVSEQVLPHLKWVRFTVLAGQPESFLKMMHGNTNERHIFWTAMHNISEAVRLKKKHNWDVTLGIQTFVTPDDSAEIIPFAQLALDLGVDYAVIKHTSDDETGTMGIDNQAYGLISETIRKAEAMSSNQTRVIAKWSKIIGINSWPPPYKRVYGCSFLLQISGSGLVAPSGMFFNARHSKFHVGDFTQERFIDMFRSERYWRVMHYLASPAMDAATMMGTLPISHYANVALDRHVKGIERIQLGTGTKPLHINFI